MGRSYQPQGAQDGRMWSRRCDLYVPADMRCRFADIFTFLQENCPRSSANLPIWNSSAFAIIRSKASFVSQHTCAVGLLTFSHFGRGTAQRARGPRQLDRALSGRQQVPRRVVCSVPHSQFGHVYNRVSVRVCTVTEEEKTALKAKLPKCNFGF